MAKEKATDTKVEETKVSVEMTEDQKKKVVEFLLKEEEEKAAREKAEPKVEFNLRFAHFVNGIQYGPGKVRVTESLGGTLYGQDIKALEGEMKVGHFTDNMIQIIQGGTPKITRIA